LISLIIPVYKNEGNLSRLFTELEKLTRRFTSFEVVFVVDGSPDRCYEILQDRLPQCSFSSQLLLLSRNFGSFPAVTAGLEVARGDYFAVLAADLQEPPHLVEQFFEVLDADRADVAFGFRRNRSDPFFSKLASTAFWTLYRRFVIHDIPDGGVDVFGCNRLVRDRVLQFHESNTNLIALLFWMGYRRAYVGYDRRPRMEGKSAWTLKKKLRYSLDSIFNFTDLPIQVLLYFGSAALAASVIGVLVELVAKLSGNIAVPGYAATVLAILFFGAVTSLGLGIVGQYLWLTLQNTRARPNYIVHRRRTYEVATSAEPMPPTPDP
jgi:polyisoprenyl-phosphate glycosyltransferase